jgi:hypothetical protein
MRTSGIHGLNSEPVFLAHVINSKYKYFHILSQVFLGRHVGITNI